MRSYIWFIIAAVVIIAAFFVFRANNNGADTQAEASPTPTAQASASPAAESSLAPEETAAIETSTSTTHTITYTDSGFSPSTLTIKQGDKVEFKNESGGAFHPASNDHPSHTIYPEFDANRDVPSGESYTFEFDKTGTWGFHNHLNPDQGGTITVE